MAPRNVQHCAPVLCLPRSCSVHPDHPVNYQGLCDKLLQILQLSQGVQRVRRIGTCSHRKTCIFRCSKKERKEAHLLPAGHVLSRSSTTAGGKLCTAARKRSGLPFTKCGIKRAAGWSDTWRKTQACRCDHSKDAVKSRFRKTCERCDRMFGPRTTSGMQPLACTAHIGVLVCYICWPHLPQILPKNQRLFGANSHNLQQGLHVAHVWRGNGLTAGRISPSDRL